MARSCCRRVPGSYEPDSPEEQFRERRFPGSHGQCESCRSKCAKPESGRHRSSSEAQCRVAGDGETRTAGTVQPRQSERGLAAANGSFYGGFVQQARVGDDLKFTLKNVPAGVYSVNLRGNYGRCYVKSMLYGGQPTPANALAVTRERAARLMLGLFKRAVERGGRIVPATRCRARESRSSRRTAEISQ